MMKVLKILILIVTLILLGNQENVILTYIDVYLEEQADDMEYENFLKSMEPIFKLIKVRETKINEEETHTFSAGYGFLFKFVKNDENYDENKAAFINKLWEEYTRLHIDREPADLKIIELVSRSYG